MVHVSVQVVSSYVTPRLSNTCLISVISFVITLYYTTYKGTVIPVPWRQMGQWMYTSHFLHLSTSCRWVVSFTLQPLYPREERPQLHCIGEWRPQSRSWWHKTKLHGLSPRANYTDRGTAACRQSDCQLVRIEGAMWSAWRIPPAIFSQFSRQEPLLFYQVAPQLYSRGWVDPVPDPLLFFFWRCWESNPGLQICSQEFWPLDHRGGCLDGIEERKFLTLPGLKLWPLSRPACRQSLYRLHYPGSTAKYCQNNHGTLK
jgi:hypothetical protein